MDEQQLLSFATTSTHLSNAWISSFLTDAPVGIAFADTDLRYRYINDRLAAMYGVHSAQGVGQQPTALFGDAGIVWEQVWQEVLTSGSPVLEREVCGSGNGARHALVSCYPLRSAENTVIGVGTLVEDITQRKRELRVRALFGKVSNMLAVSLDSRATLEAVAVSVVPELGAVCAFHLFDDQQLTLAAFAQQRTLYPRTFRPHLAAMGGELASVPQWYADILVADAPQVVVNGAAWLASLPTGAPIPPTIHPPPSVIVAPLRARGRVVGLVTLVSAPKHQYDAFDLEQARELAHRCAFAIDNARLLQEERSARAQAEAALQGRDQFLSVAAHELKTPLTSLYGNAQLLQRRIGRDDRLSPRELRNLQLVIDQAGRLNRMIESLLDMSRIDTGQLRVETSRMDLVALVRRVIQEIAPQMQQHTLTFDADQTPCMVQGDALRLEQVVQNLVQNAVRYSPQGGPVTIAVRSGADTVVLEVQDNGIGIPLDAQQRVFDRFYRAPNVKQYGIVGVGIGLFVVQQIIEQHGGTVTVQSVEGQGSTFSVQLPRAG